MNSDVYVVNSTFSELEQVKTWCDNVLGRDRCDAPFQSSFQRVPFVNLGLVLGLKRSCANGGTSSAKVTVEEQLLEEGGTLGARARKLIADFPTDMAEKVLSSFIIHNKDCLKVNRHIPWFIREEQGGYGLPSVGSYGPSNLDVFLAGGIVAKHFPPPPPRPVVSSDDAAIGTKLYEQATRRSSLEFSDCSEKTNGHLVTDYYFWSLLILGFSQRVLMFNTDSEASCKEEVFIDMLDVDQVDRIQTNHRRERYWAELSRTKISDLDVDWGSEYWNWKEDSKSFVAARVIS
jgi:hypothetical protein